MKKLWALVLAGCIAAVLSTAAWATETPTAWDGSNLTLADGSYYLNGDVTISGTLTIEGTVTLDLNGWVLQRVNTSENGSVIHVKSGTLTLKDSNQDAEHRFTANSDGLWVPATDGDKVVKGGVITGGTGGTYTHSNAKYKDCGGGVFVAPGASFIMEGGNIVGCSAKGSDGGGGVYVANYAFDYTYGRFLMSGGTISGCVARNGGGLRNDGTATLSGNAKIENCHATGNEEYDSGGVCSLRNLTVSGNVVITGCTAANGMSGAMYVLGGNDGESSSIKGGTFDGSVLFYKNGGGSISVSGGTFNDKVTFDDDGSSGTITVSGGTFKNGASGVWTVTFNTNGGTPEPESQIRANLPAAKPDDPTKEGYTFGGWYTDEAFTSEYTFTESEKVTQDMTLYAKWTKEAPKYYYYSPADGSADAPKASPKTFDAGVGVYMGMAVLSASGSAVVLGKKRK